MIDGSFNVTRMNGTFTYRFGGQEYSVTCHDLHSFAENIGLTKACQDRWSYLLALDIYMQFHHSTVTPEDIVREIYHLETDPSQSRTKASAPFTRAILAGLWHKHYFTAAHVPKNLLNQLSGNKLTEIIEGACGSDTGQVLNQEMANEIVYATTHGTFSERLNAGRLTGEWIVFTKHNGANYYLCLGMHTDDDAGTLARVHAYCASQFSFL